jgi:hypothetical protein
MTSSERQMQAWIRSLPPGQRREFLESKMLPDREKALARFRQYALRAEQELPAWELNWMSARMGNLLGESFAVHDTVKAEQAERKRAKKRLKVVSRRA